MKRFGLLSSSAISSAAFVGISLAFAAPAQAQETPAAEQDESEEVAQPAADQPAESGGILVTGTRIRRPNLESTVPITSIGGEQIFQQGETSLGETLNELPQLRSTFAQSNPGLGIGVTGLNLLDLRGLGSQRTLVLVNGRRHVPADVLVNAVSPDINTIPADLIDRIDIVTGGNSAIYGSDAIAGVVNFILRRDFDGLQVRGQANITEEGFGANQYGSVMYGMNFAEGRGNVTVHGEYYRQERVFASDIPDFQTNDGLFVVDADTGGLPNNSDGFPDRIFMRDVRSTTIHYHGLIPIAQPADNAATGAREDLCGTGIANSNGGPSNVGGTPYNCTYFFSPTGRLVQQTGAIFGSGQLGSRLGGNGQTGREGPTFGVLPFLERYNVNLLAHYEFTPAFELFFEGKFTRIDSFGRNAGPSFIQGQTTQFDQRERLRLDNPFLHPDDRTLLTGLILTSGLNPRLAARTPLGTAGLGLCTVADVNAGTCRFDFAKNLLDLGNREEIYRRDTYRFVGGLRGTFWDDWSYEVSVNYGEFQEDVRVEGFIDRQRFMLAMDSGRDAAGAIRCRSQFDAAARQPFDGPGFGTGSRTNASQPGRLAADVAACIPYNPFGEADNRASIAYFTRQFTSQSELTQLVLNGFVSGDTSEWFELPGGPLRFALGVEYRREQIFYEQDPFVTQHVSDLSGATNTNAVAISRVDPDDPFEVKEAFAELQIPILRDEPFFHELTISGAARVARYQGDTGTVWAYNAGIDWAPIRDIRFRGNYSRAVRAPNVSETGFPLVPNFAPGFQDPCMPANINTGANRARNCQTALGANIGNLINVTQSLPIISGSNADLIEETSDSWTLGVVIQPRWIPGFSLSVDYYNIKVADVIVSVAAQTIVNSCYDSVDLNNVFCAAFTRFAGPGTGPFGEDPGEIVGNSLIVAPLNFASRDREGIDVNLNYRVNLSADVRLNAGLIYTHNLTISNFQDPVRPTFENRILGELGDPEDEFRFDLDISYREFTLGYRMRYIGEMWTNTYENFNGLNASFGIGTGATPVGGDDADWSQPREYPVITYHDLRFEWNIRGGGGITEELRFYFGVDNVLDQMPPLGADVGATGVGANRSIYEYRGRNFYGGFRARF